MLVSAPTGAGKTNIAMITVLHEIGLNMSRGIIDKSAFKIVYVAPMKALASEMTRNFGSRLEQLGIQVRRPLYQCFFLAELSVSSPGKLFIFII